MTRCETCWRLAVFESRELEAEGRPRPRPFTLYIAHFEAHHPGGATEHASAPLEVSGFGRSL